MTQVSPSSKKVDEFLSSLSQLSQERLRDNQQRQRDLQRDIDDLRRTSPIHHNDHGITELKFNRSARGAFHDKWKDSVPDVPSRDDDGPPLPDRPKPERPIKYGTKSSLEALQGERLGRLGKPEKPQKPEKLHNPEITPKLPTRPASQQEVGVQIAKPVARASEKPATKVNIPQYSVRRGVEAAGQIRSFGELEKQIQDGSRVFSNSKPEWKSKPEIPSKAKPEAPSKSKPEVPLKPAKSISSIPVAVSTSKPLVSVKPKPKADLQVLETKFLSKVGDRKLGVATLKPLKPAKPSLKSFQLHDTQELKNQIQRLSPTKSAGSNERRSFETIKPVAISSLKPVKPSKPKAIEVPEVPEALNALAKLKPTKPEKPKTEKPIMIEKAIMVGKFVAEKPVAERPTKPTKSVRPEPQTSKMPTNTFLSSNSNSFSIPKDSAALTDEQPDFRSRLSNMLRANTDPAVKTASRVEPIRRSQSTATSSTKLTHPNKSRAKGPKRKLPKLIGSASASTSSSVAGSAAVSASASVEEFSPVSIAPITNSGSMEENQQNDHTNQQQIYKLELSKKKTPPPIRTKKPSLQPRQKRIVSGDLFL